MKKTIALFVMLMTFSFVVNAQKITDRHALGLKGLVKRATYSDGNSIAFDKQGKVISVKNKDGKYAKKIYHNQQGLVSLAQFEDGSKFVFKYKNGKVSSIGMHYLYWTEAYVYSNFTEGLPWTIKYKAAGEAVTSTVTAKVQYGNHDSHGNWCWRRLIGDMNTVDERDGSSYTEDFDESITRQIFYW